MISATPQSPRLTRFAVLAVGGATALSIAACTSSNKSNPTSTMTSTSTSTSTETSTPGAPPPAAGEAQVNGMIASVAGSAIQVTQKDDSNATVDYTPTTKITEITPAALADVKPGSCVTAQPRAEAEGGQPATAASVRLSPAVDGKCPQAPAPTPATQPAPPPPGSPAPAPAEPTPVRGSVASVADKTINITTNDVAGNPVQTAVTVDDNTTYTKAAEATNDAITQGKCLDAHGAKDAAGTLQATSITLQPAVDKKCPEPEPQGQGG